MSAERAERAVRLGEGLGRLRGTSPLAALGGRRITKGPLEALHKTLDQEVAEDGANARLVSLATIRTALERDRIARVAMAAAAADDAVTLLVVAVLISTLTTIEPDLVGRLSGQLFRCDLPGGARVQERRRLADRVLGAAYALTALDSWGLDLGNEWWNGAPPSWRFRAAPWVLSVLDPESPAAVRELLDAAVARKLSFVLPGECPFEDPGRTGDVDLAKSMATSAAQDMTKWAAKPVWFDGGPGNPQVLLVEDDTYAYAWVGANRRGMLVCFDTTSFFPFMLNEPGTAYAVATAIGWFIDVCVALHAKPAGTTGITRTSAPTARRGPSYRPTPHWTAQASSVSTGARTPPRPHMVAAFVRTLSAGQRPNRVHVLQAPTRLRSRMGPRDTWVQAHTRGGHVIASDWPTRLSQYSALADILGEIRRRREKS